MQGAGLLILAAQLPDGTAGCSQLLLAGSAFHGKEAATHLDQRQAVLGQHGQSRHRTGRGQVKLLPPCFAGGFLGALLGKLHPGQAQLSAGILQELHPLAGGLHQGQLQLGLVDLCHDARESGTGTHVHHLPCHLGLAGKQQAVEEVLVLNALRVGDGGQIDFLVVVHQDLRKVIQLVQLVPSQRNVPHGTFLLQSRFIDHFAPLVLDFKSTQNKNAVKRFSCECTNLQHFCLKPSSLGSPEASSPWFVPPAPRK